VVQHCYLVQTHREPLQIRRLVARIRRDSPRAHIVIAHDATAAPLDAQLFARLDVHVLGSMGPVVRGEFSMVDAYFHAVREISARGLDYDWLTLISGQDYPLRPLASYEQHLEREPFDAYLQYGDVLGPDSPWAARRSQGRLRYFYRYRRLDERWKERRWLMRRLNGLQKIVHFHTTLAPYLGVRTLNHPFTQAFRCYGGSAWHTLSRTCVSFLGAERERNTQLVEHFRHTMSPEEAFVHTVLVNSQRFRIHRGNLRFIDFTGSIGGSPRTLTRTDLTTLVASECFFARKFDVNVDAEVLDDLDRLAGVTIQPSARADQPPSAAAMRHTSTEART
jgi:hypothetical protein